MSDICRWSPVESPSWNRASEIVRATDANDALAATETKGDGERDDAPYVCPGCHAVGERCAPGCIDAEIEQEREDLRGEDRDSDEENDDA